MAINYRPDQKNEGVFKAFGPVSEMRIGPVRVETKSGKLKDETITALSNPFMVDGVPHCYGDLQRDGDGKGGGRRPTPNAGSGEGRRKSPQGTAPRPRRDVDDGDPNVLLDLALQDERAGRGA